MSQQINLYDPALLRKRELLTALNLAIAAGVLAAIVVGWGMAARVQLAKVETESRQLVPVVKGLQEQLVAVTKQVAGARPDPRLEAELAAAREKLRLRNEVLVALKKGVGSDSPSFAEYLRGFARQAPRGLWLTGFKIADGGMSMEIQGRMTDASLLPDYIARLNREPAFRGRAFAALKVNAGKIETPVPRIDAPAARPGMPAAGSPSSAPGAASAPFLEFTLIPATTGGKAGQAAPEQADNARGMEGVR